jgi:hypothetical protein
MPTVRSGVASCVRPGRPPGHSRPHVADHRSLNPVLTRRSCRQLHADHPVARPSPLQVRARLPHRTTGPRVVINNSLHHWQSRLQPGRARPHVYASSTLGVNARICRDEVRREPPCAQ